MVKLILLKRLGGWNYWIKRAAFDTWTACWLPRLYRPVFENKGIGEKFRTSNAVNVIRYTVFGLAVFKIPEHTLLSKLSVCSACDQFDCFLFRSPRSKSQTILGTSKRADRSSKKMPFWGMRTSLYAVYLIQWLFNNAVSNARVNTWKKPKIWSWMESSSNFESSCFWLFLKSAKKPNQLTRLRIMGGRVYLVDACI